MYESVQSFLQQRERKNERKKVCVYLDLRRTVLRKKRKRISRVAITRVPTHPLLLLLFVVVVVAFFFFVSVSLRRPSASSKSFPEEDIFFRCEAREKDFMKEKDEKRQMQKQKKKMCQTDEKRRGRFFRPLVFFVLSKSKSSKRARSLELHS